MAVLYNEIAPYPAQWTRNLIDAGLVAPGVVDERSIADLTPEDLEGYTQAHFFAGVGVWSAALRAAGWGDDREIWTGSCPCQPFSRAGLGKGTDDERHLWPEWFRLIRACRPRVIVGEQVSSSDAVGRAVGSDMHEMWERRSALNLFENWLQQHVSKSLQGVPEHDSSTEQFEESNDHGTTFKQTIGISQSPREGTQSSVRTGSRLGQAPVGSRILRGDRDRVRPNQQARMEHTFAGSNQSTVRVHESEYPIGSVCAQHCLRQLGADPVDGSVSSVGHDAEAAVREARKRLDESVSKAGGGAWFATVQSDLEGAGYAVWAFDTCAASVGAPHIRQRLYFVAVRTEDLLGDTRVEGAGRNAGAVSRAQGKGEGEWERAGHLDHSAVAAGAVDWRDPDWVWCRDGKWRPVERPAQPRALEVADGTPAWLECVRAAGPRVVWEEVPDPKPSRTAMIHAYGNAIVLPLATAFVRAVMDVLEENAERKVAA